LRNIHQKEFKPLLQSRITISSAHLSVKFVSSNKVVCSVVVSKKVFKKAHDRFRVKRRVYSIIETKIINSTQLLHGFYLLTVKSNAILSLSVKNLEVEVIDLISRLSVQIVTSLTKKRTDRKLP
jgi:ribonuclease P protein component